MQTLKATNKQGTIQLLEPAIDKLELLKAGFNIIGENNANRGGMLDVTAR